jgi:putative acetyltransferase
VTAERNFRWADASDYDALGEVMFDAVRNGRSRYNERQRQAWAPEPRRGHAWNDRLSEQDIIVAQTANRILGFISCTREGYIDFAYIRPEAQHTGLFRELFEHIREQASARGLSSLWVHASLMAQPAFAAVGFTITGREEVAIGEERFDRFHMTRTLPA